MRNIAISTFTYTDSVEVNLEFEVKGAKHIVVATTKRTDDELQDIFVAVKEGLKAIPLRFHNLFLHDYQNYIVRPSIENI